jgi:hypothetical protein
LERGGDAADDFRAAGRGNDVQFAGVVIFLLQTLKKKRAIRFRERKMAGKNVVEN